MTKKIGITGGIGSGKSTVCSVFRILGVPVFEADVIAKDLYRTNHTIRIELIRLFGADIYTSDGMINRAKLSAIIFSNDFYLQKINELIHPVVRDEFQLWLKKNNDCSYVIHEAAILFESGLYTMMDYNILVTAPEEQRIERVAARDGISSQMIRERMKRQWPEEKKMDLADKVLVNDNKWLLIPEIIEMNFKLKEYGSIW
ncbi:MAG: dephospho-CoA kinase [Mariniphaga sp.]|nr:dephospho-CoA kinase [Mariniphaga sp.]